MGIAWRVPADNIHAEREVAMPLRMDVKAKPTDPVVARWADGYTISLPQYSQSRLRMFCAFAGRAEDARRVNALNLEKSQWVVKDMAPARHGIDPAQHSK